MLWNKDVYGAEYDRNDVNSKLCMMGGSITALEVHLIDSTLDYFIGCEGVNRNRLGVAGLSYGGQYALDLAAFDTRIKACASLGFFNDRFIYSERDWSYPNSLLCFGDAEKAGLICPRALVVSIGDDYIFDYKSALEEGEYVKQFYKEFDALEKYDFYVFNGSHETDKGDRWVDFLIDNL